MEEYLREYRSQLVNGRQSVMENYEKTILSLSTGALALSVTFVKDVFKPIEGCTVYLLYASWLFWVISIIVMVFAFYLCQLAFDYAIKQVDNDTIKNNKVGGCYTTIINILSPVGGLAFLSGVIFMVFFGILNLR